MDQSKLLQIINKDLAELKELTDELIQTGRLSKIEIEIALSKSKLILQEFELLKEEVSKGIEEQKAELTNTSGHTSPPTITEPEKTEACQASENGSRQKPEIDPNEIGVDEAKAEMEKEINDEIQYEIIEDQEEKEVPIENNVESSQTGSDTEKNQKEPNNQAETSFKPDDTNIEDDEEEEPAILVGETFSKGKSLNDTLSESQTIDQKFASSPISKLEPAIGLNDRFLFVRELFDGDSNKFSEAVNKLDNFNDLKEAVDYLSTNYKWKKTETSLKFVELVKRRFQS